MQVPAEVESDGQSRSCRKLLGEIVRKLEAGTGHGRGHRRRGRDRRPGGSRPRCALKPAEDFPRLRRDRRAAACASTRRAFAEALRQVVPAASKDDLGRSSPVCCSPRTAGGLRLVATDSYRLAVRDLEGVSMLAEGQQVLVAAKGLAEVQRLLPATARSRWCSASATSCSASATTEVTARLIEGDFPNYEQLIPSGYPNRLTVARDALQRSGRPGADRRPEPRQRAPSGSR